MPPPRSRRPIVRRTGARRHRPCLRGDAPCATGGAFRGSPPHVLAGAAAHRHAGIGDRRSSHLREQGLRDLWWPHGLRREPRGYGPARHRLRRQNSQRHQARRPPRRAAHQVRTRHQPQDRQGPRPDDPAVPPTAGGSGHRVMDRRTFLGTLTGGLLAAPLAAETQQTDKAWRVGQLVTSEFGGLDAFHQRLRELGYIEGRNLSIEHRNAEGRTDRLPALVADLVRLRADLIVTFGTQAALAAKQGTTEIPIVMATSGDPVGAGLIRSLARPGGNVTGTSGSSPELSRKRLELLTEAFPKKVHVVILWNPANALHILEREETVAAARTLRLKLEWLEARNPDEIDAAFSAATRARADVLVVFPDPVFWTKREQILNHAAKHRLPGIYAFREYTEGGGLMSCGPNLSDMLGRAAIYVDKILRGAKRADLPVQQPTRFELVINLKTANALGLTIPPSLLARADQVIE